jgi:predicted transcriptional regulator
VTGTRKRRPGTPLAFSRREKQVLDALYECSPATVADVLERMPKPPGYSAVRAMLARLETKGYVRHADDGQRYLYEPVHPREHARASLLKRLVDAYFDGSPTKLVAAMLDRKAIRLSEKELDEVAKLVADARRGERA